MAKMRVGLVGCGNIGTDICIAAQADDCPFEIAALTDLDSAHAEALREQFELVAPTCTLDENAASVDFIVECAGASAVAPVVEAAIAHRIGCLVMSIGALLGQLELLDAARNGGIELRLPSGALCGLDGVRSAKEAGLDSVTLTTRKPPQGLKGASFLAEQDIDLDNLREPRVVFEGSAGDACKALPKNVNVAAALSLAGLGPDATRVRVVADPAATSNSHEIEAVGAFGKLVARTENMPSPRNPKSSYLASLSAVAELRSAAQAFRLRNG